jgi:hypothetical protein
MSELKQKSSGDSKAVLEIAPFLYRLGSIKKSQVINCSVTEEIL